MLLAGEKTQMKKQLNKYIRQNLPTKEVVMDNILGGKPYKNTHGML